MFLLFLRYYLLIFVSSHATSPVLSLHGSLDAQAYTFTKFFLDNPVSAVNVSASFDSLPNERVLIVVKYGGLPLAEEWQTSSETDPIVWGEPGVLQIEIQDARAGWYFVGVFDTLGLDTELHELGGDSFDFVINVFLGSSLLCRPALVQGVSEDSQVESCRTTLVSSARNDCYQFFVPDFTEKIEITFSPDNTTSNLLSSSSNILLPDSLYLRWKGMPSSSLYTSTESSLDYPLSGWWYLASSSPFIPVIRGVSSTLQPVSPVAVRYDDPIFTDWQLGAVNDTLFVLELGPDSVGGELRLAPQISLYRSLNISGSPFVKAGELWFRPVVGTYILSLSTNASSLARDRSLVGASRSVEGSTLLPSLASTSLNDINSEETLAIGDTVAYMAQCPADCFDRGNCGVRRGLVPFGACSNCVRFSGLACQTEVISLSAYTGMVMLLVFSNLTILPAAYRAHKMRLHFEAVVYVFVCIASATYHLCDQGSYCIASYSSLHLLDFLLSFYAIVVTVVYSVGHSGWTKDVANFIALLILVFANMQNSNFWEYLLFGITLTILIVMPLIRDRALLLPPWDDRMAWGGLFGALLLLGIALMCQYGFLSNHNYFYVHSIWHFTIQLCPLLCIFWQRGPKNLLPAAQLSIPVYEKIVAP